MRHQDNTGTSVRRTIYDVANSLISRNAMTTRRDFCIGTTATLAAASLAQGAPKSPADAAAEKLISGFTEELLVEYPESATMLGIDNGARALLKSRLSDRSAAGQKAIAMGVARRLEKLKAIDPASLGNAARIDVDVMRTAHEFALEGFAFPYGDVALLNSQWSWRNAPYVVAQNTGAFLEIPGMLEEQHTVQSSADAEAWLGTRIGVRGSLRAGMRLVLRGALRRRSARHFLRLALLPIAVSLPGRWVGAQLWPRLYDPGGIER